MAYVFVTEYAGVARVGSAYPPVAKGPPLAEQRLAVGSETKSNAFHASTAIIRVHTDAICSVLIGTAPTATTSSARMAADQTEYFAVPVGASYKISIIANT